MLNGINQAGKSIPFGLTVVRARSNSEHDRAELNRAYEITKDAWRKEPDANLGISEIKEDEGLTRFDYEIFKPDGQTVDEASELRFADGLREVADVNTSMQFLNQKVGFDKMMDALKINKEAKWESNKT